MSDKKLVVYYAPRMTRDGALKKMLNFMHNLSAVGINCYHVDVFTLQFETRNVRVRYILKESHLDGMKPDEIFANDWELDGPLVRSRLLPNDPYPGTMMDYIIEIEKAAEAEESRLEQHDITPDELVYFAENILGIELMDCQKAVLKAWADLRKSFGGKPAKVCYGRHGKVYVFPVEEKED